MTRGRSSLSGDFVRRLALLAWIDANPGVSVEAAAEHFGVTPERLVRDVEVLWSAGPAHGYEYLDFDAGALEEEGRLYLTNSQGVSQPVRLTHTEALSLELALRALAGLLEGDEELGAAIHEALGVLEEASRDVRETALLPDSAHVGSKDETLPVVRQALENGRVLAIRYVSATDEVSEREVEPIELTSRDPSHIVLRAWCRTAHAERRFRLDRILEARLTEDDVHPTRRRRAASKRPRARTIAAGGEQATLRLAPSGAWIAESLPTTAVRTLADGRMDVSLRGRDRAWLRTLVLSAGRSLLDVQPADLAREAAESARQALAESERVRAGDTPALTTPETEGPGRA